MMNINTTYMTNKTKDIYLVYFFTYKTSFLIFITKAIQYITCVTANINKAGLIVYFDSSIIYIMILPWKIMNKSPKTANNSPAYIKYLNTLLSQQSYAS